MPRLTPYAEHLLARGSAPDTPAPSPPDWITTTTAAKLTNYSIRWIISLCDRGFFVEGQEWKQRPPCPGSRKGGRIWIKHSALKKLEPSMAEVGQKPDFVAIVPGAPATKANESF